VAALAPEVQDDVVVEYGGTINQGAGAVGGSGSFDVTSDVMGAFGDLFDRIASLPPEILVLIAGIMLLGGLVFSRRSA
jgi:hypothetical protein